MQIAKDTVVSFMFELADAEGRLIEKSEEPVSYLHGGYQGMFPAVERALEGLSQGQSCDVTLEPEDAFGAYDAGLKRVEPRHLFPDHVAVGMQFEGRPEGAGAARVFTVTGVSAEEVTVDGNHPLAGQVLNFACTVTGVRRASAEEVAHGHVHGPQDHHHGH